MTRVDAFPFSIDWLPGGLMLVTAGQRLLRMEGDGSLVTHVDLTALSDHGWNEIVVDGRANAYINNIEFDLMGGEDRSRDHRPGRPRWHRPAGGGRSRLPQRDGGHARQLDADRRRVL